MKVELPQRFRAMDDLGGSFQARQQRDHQWRRAQYHGGTASGDQLGVAAELDRVTVPLLGMQQDRSVGKVFLAEPRRPLEERMRSARHHPNSPARFVLPPTALEIAGYQQADGAVEPRLGEVAARRDGAVEARKRLIDPAKAGKRVATAVMGPG